MTHGWRLRSYLLSRTEPFDVGDLVEVIDNVLEASSSPQDADGVEALVPEPLVGRAGELVLDLSHVAQLDLRLEDHSLVLGLPVRLPGRLCEVDAAARQSVFAAEHPASSKDLGCILLGGLMIQEQCWAILEALLSGIHPRGPPALAGAGVGTRADHLHLWTESAPREDHVGEIHEAVAVIVHLEHYPHHLAGRRTPLVPGFGNVASNSDLIADCNGGARGGATTAAATALARAWPGVRGGPFQF
mmetsp:Transcript_89774/g.187578  ORF Transcript_89774/g.187578 Transcript_89774/m.187578 type:complete len:245 (+) Transcript_89774:811-1545(+)